MPEKNKQESCWLLIEIEIGNQLRTHFVKYQHYRDLLADTQYSKAYLARQVNEISCKFQKTVHSHLKAYIYMWECQAMSI